MCVCVCVCVFFLLGGGGGVLKEMCISIEKKIIT